MTKAEAQAKIKSIALEQVGYHEGANNYNKYADDPKIAKLYGWTPQNQPWCCVFVNWCFLNAFGYDIGSRLTYGGTAACANSAQLFVNEGAYVHSPEVGDQAFFYSGGGINHTGIVVSVSGGSFVTVEGNYSDKVSKVNHNTSDSAVAGFGRPNWAILGKETSSQPSSGASNTNSQTYFPDEDHRLQLPLLSYSNVYRDACVFLQALLNLRHFACGSADGFYGAKTQAAVGKAQRYFNLEVDGICGPETWSKLLEQQKS